MKQPPSFFSYFEPLGGSERSSLLMMPEFIFNDSATGRKEEGILERQCLQAVHGLNAQYGWTAVLAASGLKFSRYPKKTAPEKPASR